MPTRLLSVTGMHCEHCQGRVESALAEVPGVVAATVSLTDETATVEGSATMEALVAAVEAVGFQAAPHAATPEGVSIRLRVTGMHCEHCSGRVEQTLAELPGVVEASVDLEAETATVRGCVPVATLIAAIVEVGFGAELLDGGGGNGVGGVTQVTEDEERTSTLLHVDGLKTHACSDRVAHALASVHGVTNTSIDLKSNQVLVEGPAQPSTLVAALNAVGKAARLISSCEKTGQRPRSASSLRAAATEDDEKCDLLPRSHAGKNGSLSDSERAITISIDGMTCAACVGAVERALLAHRGVVLASVSLMSKSGRVRFDERTTRANDVIAAVCRLGYKAELQEGSEAQRAASPGYADEARTWRRQFQGSLCFTVPIFFISMVLPHTPMRHYLHRDVVPGMTWRVLLLWILTTPVQFGFGRRFYRSAYAALSHGATNMDVLVALGSSAAYFYSVPESCPPILRPKPTRVYLAPTPLPPPEHRPTAPTCRPHVQFPCLRHWTPPRTPSLHPSATLALAHRPFSASLPSLTPRSLYLATGRLLNRRDHLLRQASVR